MNLKDTSLGVLLVDNNCIFRDNIVGSPLIDFKCIVVKKCLTGDLPPNLVIHSVFFSRNELLK